MSDNAISIPATQRLFNDDSLAEISSLSDALAALEGHGATAESMADYGNGFSVVDDKRRLVGVPFVILEWRFNDSDMSDLPFVSATAVTQTGEKVIINDGSTGVRDQLLRITKRRLERGHPTPAAGLMVPKGLTESNYTFTDADGKDRPATTFYLSESA